MNEDSATSQPVAVAGSLMNKVVQLGRRPRILLVLLAGWSVLTVLTQVFVNSGLFLDIHDIELDGALGGFALSFQAIPLALLYLYCWRDPEHYRSVFWLAMVHQGAMVVGAFYQWAIGTYSFESIIVLLVGSISLGVLSFLQLFQPKPAGST